MGKKEWKESLAVAGVELQFFLILLALVGQWSSLKCSIFIIGSIAKYLVVAWKRFLISRPTHKVAGKFRQLADTAQKADTRVTQRQHMVGSDDVSLTGPGRFRKLSVASLLSTGAVPLAHFPPRVSSFS